MARQYLAMKEVTEQQHSTKTADAQKRGGRSPFAAITDIPAFTDVDPVVKTALRAPPALTGLSDSVQTSFKVFCRPPPSEFVHHSSASGRTVKARPSSEERPLSATGGHEAAMSRLHIATLPLPPQHTGTPGASSATECCAGCDTGAEAKRGSFPCCPTTCTPGADCMPPEKIGQNVVRRRGTHGADWRSGGTAPVQDEKADSACNVLLDELHTLIGSAAAPENGKFRRRSPGTKLRSKGDSGRPQIPTGRRRRSRCATATRRRKGQDVVLTHKEAGLVLDVMRKFENLEMTDGACKGQLRVQCTIRHLKGQVDMGCADVLSECDALTRERTEQAEPAEEAVEESSNSNEAGDIGESKEF